MPSEPRQSNSESRPRVVDLGDLLDDLDDDEELPPGLGRVRRGP